MHISILFCDSRPFSSPCRCLFCVVDVADWRELAILHFHIGASGRREPETANYPQRQMNAPWVSHRPNFRSHSHFGQIGLRLHLGWVSGGYGHRLSGPDRRPSIQTHRTRP